MSRVFFAALLASAIAATPALAQDHMMGGMQTPGMKMPPAKSAAKPSAKKSAAAKSAGAEPSARKPAATPRSAAKRAAPPVKEKATAEATATKAMPAMDHGAMTMPMPPAAKPDPMAGMSMGEDHSAHAMAPGMTMPGMNTPATTMDHAMPGMAPVGTALPAGNAPAPPAPMDHYADRFFPAAAMTQSRETMMREQGGQRFAQIMFNLAEVQIRNGRDGYRWDGQVWFGGDIDRLVLKTEGSGAFRAGVEAAEVQALFSRAIGPYFNLQAGVRHDFQPSPTRTYATIGVEGLAPYMFDVGAAAFLSDKGEVLGRLDGYYDQRITQRLILQPRVEINLSAQDVPETRTGAGVVDAELGLRLRYEFSREFAPYVGVSYEAKLGDTADYARAVGDDPTTTSLVAGVRFWF